MVVTQGPQNPPRLGGLQNSPSGRFSRRSPQERSGHQGHLSRTKMQTLPDVILSLLMANEASWDRVRSPLASSHPEC